MYAVQAVVVVLGSVLLAAGVAVACGRGGAVFLELPLFGWLALWCFVLNWLAFVPAFLKRTERFYDLVGSATFLTVTVAAVVLAGVPDLRALLAAAFVVVWALRLGIFLFRRVHQDGGDGRFDDIKQSFPRFLIAWTVQALWVLVTSSAALVAITSTTRPPLDVALVLGAVLWGLGFTIEVVADAQKRAFKRDPQHRGGFISTGLWAWSRHPNYFGEILLWVGVLVLASSTMVGTQWVAALSPVFVAVLLTAVSGVPILERRADARFGDDPAYRAYKEKTPTLIPWPPKRA